VAAADVVAGWMLSIPDCRYAHCFDCSEMGSGAKVRLIVEGVRSVQMVRGKAGGLVRFSTLDGAEDLTMFRQGELLQARLADEIEVELDKPSKQRLAETREDRVASDDSDAVVKPAIRSQERVRIETGSFLLDQDRV
jgi:hypothetical protein